jgi:FKBP-type peptidyl-prolyl cis-trans isomerase FkpA/FKBP-type peptidyl-prolyl cis-trans isomerase FklB
MLRAILFSLAALVVLMIVARSCGLTPEQVESQVMLAELNAEEGIAFRRENRARPGVVELPGGLQVEMLTRGEGTIPSESDWVVVHYRGLHIDGRVFEDSRRRGDPAVVPIERVIEGWRRALVAMPVGSSVRLTIPPELAYGRPGGGPIGPEETLIFELELLAIGSAPEPVVRDPSQMPVPGLR